MPFDEVCTIVCSGKYSPEKIDGQVWYELEANIEIIEQHNQSAYNLICFLLKYDSDVYIYENYIIKCVNGLHSLNSKEKEKLKELLLKNNISLSSVKVID